jgi:hypothetical protein
LEVLQAIEGGSENKNARSSDAGSGLELICDRNCSGDHMFPHSPTMKPREQQQECRKQVIFGL